MAAWLSLSPIWITKCFSFPIVSWPAVVFGETSACYKLTCGLDNCYLLDFVFLDFSELLQLDFSRLCASCVLHWPTMSQNSTKHWLLICVSHSHMFTENKFLEIHNTRYKRYMEVKTTNFEGLWRLTLEAADIDDIGHGGTRELKCKVNPHEPQVSLLG